MVIPPDTDSSVDFVDIEDVVVVIVVVNTVVQSVVVVIA
jgi:hypothetical protein